MLVFVATNAMMIHQIARDARFDAPEICDWHIGDPTRNPHNALICHFVFRMLFALILILTLISVRLPAARAGGAPEPLRKTLPPPPESSEATA